MSRSRRLSDPSGHTSSEHALPDDATVGRVLRWLADTLADAAVPFQIVGGVAARAYGGTRPVVDVDLYVPCEAFPRLCRSLAPLVVRPPARHRDEHWDLTFCAIEREGVTIEIAADDGFVHDRRVGHHVPVSVDYDQSVPISVFGVVVPVMPKSQLVEYKAGLARAPDAADLAELHGS